MKDCRVRHLQIRAQAESAAYHTASRLEDALRIASLPAEQSRVVIVRALALGKLSHQATSAQLALRIEQRLQQLPHDLVHATAPTAATADAVYFSDDAEPVILLALRIARNEPVQHWFWPLAVQAWHPQMAPAVALRLLLRTVTASSAGVAALVRMIHTLRAAGSVQPIFAALRAEDGLALLHLCGWHSQPAPASAVQARNPGLAPQPNAQLLMEWLMHWGVDDARSQWLANLLLVLAQPVWLCAPELSQQGRAWIEQIAASALPINLQRALVAPPLACLPTTELAGQRPPTAVPDQPQELATARQSQVADDRASPSVPDPPVAAGRGWPTPDPPTSPAGAWPNSQQAEQASRSDPTAHGPSGHAGAAPHSQPPSGPAGQAQAVTVNAPRLAVPTADLVAAPPFAWLMGEGQQTAYAGLFFLLPVLTRLGIQAWLQANPAWIELDLPRRLLWAICQQLGVPGADPIWGAVAFPATALPDTLPAFLPPASWSAFADGLATLTHVADTPLAAAVQQWQAALHAWCEQVLKLALTAVVQRSGRISLTPTHIDIGFALQQTDLHIRRAGLDIDPGWVVWLGRVVLFHYEDLF